MDALYSVGLVLVAVILGATAYTDTDYAGVQRSLDVLKRVKRARLHRRDVPDVDELNIAITRLIKREAIKHNHFQHLKNIHLALMRRKRGWLTDDPTNRATEFPTSTTTTLPPPPLPTDITVPGETNTAVLPSTTSPETTDTVLPTMTYSVNTTVLPSTSSPETTNTATPTMTYNVNTTGNTTESSSTHIIPYLLNYVVAIVIVLAF